MKNDPPKSEQAGGGCMRDSVERTGPSSLLYDGARNARFDPQAEPRDRHRRRDPDYHRRRRRRSGQVGYNRAALGAGPPSRSLPRTPARRAHARESGSSLGPYASPRSARSIDITAAAASSRRLVASAAPPPIASSHAT